MKSIITWVQSALLKLVSDLDLSPLPDKPSDKLRPGPEQLLGIIYSQALAEWALRVPVSINATKSDLIRAFAPQER